jgi:hypothetical protein
VQISRIEKVYLAAIAVLLIASLYLSISSMAGAATPLDPEASAPPKSQAILLEWRAIAFTYQGGKYERAVDMFDKAFPSQTDCMAAVRDGIAAVRPGMKAGEGIVGTCVHIPAFVTHT